MPTMTRKATSAIERLPMAVQLDLNGLMLEAKSIAFLRPDGNPDPKWIMFPGITLAEARTKAMDAVRRGGGDTSRVMAEVASRDASRVMAEVEAIENVKAVTLDAALHAIWILAGASGQDVAVDAVRDLSLKARMTVLKDTFFKDKLKHIKHASERVDVWKKGYCLAGVAGDTFYVYYQEKPFWMHPQVYDASRELLQECPINI